MRVKLENIIPDPNQPRKTLNKEAINELQSSFGALGLIQPIIVKPTSDGKYMIIVGERRFTATKQRGDTEIECIIREGIDDKTIREMQFAENTQQENIPPLELGKAFAEHRKKFNLTQRELADIIGISKDTINHYEALCIAAIQVQSYVQSGELDASTAYEISTIKDPGKQAELAQVTVKEGLSRAVIRESKPLLEALPNRPTQSIIAQARYNISTLKTNHRDILEELKRNQIEPQPTPEGKYKTIVIDPPWSIEKILRDTRPNQFDIDYPTMTTDEIMQLPIAELADENGCHIYLWTTHKYLPIAFDVLEAWGANYQCLLTWVKNVGMTPFSFMYSTEHCLFARIGNLPLLKMGERLDFQAKVREHSRKPKEFYDLVKKVSPQPRIDYFAREAQEGFESWGNEKTKFNIGAVV